MLPSLFTDSSSAPKIAVHNRPRLRFWKLFSLNQFFMNDEWIRENRDWDRHFEEKTYNCVKDDGWSEEDRFGQVARGNVERVQIDESSRTSATRLADSLHAFTTVHDSLRFGVFDI
jgi:hypothetical protein